MNDGYGLFPYSIYADSEIDHYEDRFLYGSLDGRYPEENLLRELDEDESKLHASESIREKPHQVPVDVKKALFYTRELSEAELEGFDMILLAKIGEPVYVR